jgi:LPPG:FO 2-phospho-L-lactate transferase
MKLVALAGGTGAAKFLRGLSTAADPRSLTIIGNTGDDFELWGLSISPDLDTVMYTLAGLVDDAKGWGVDGDTFHCLGAMGQLGRETFFALGDKDLAVHIRRTEELRAGAPLSLVTDSLRTTLGVKSRILPMSDDRVRTRIRTPDKWLGFQEFFVGARCEPEVLDVAYEGADRSHPAPGVLEAMHEADAIIICPSNPVSSVGPILAVPGIRGALLETKAPIIAVSPMVGDAPVSGPAGKMMRALRFEVSATGVADAYQGNLDVLIVDRRDEGCTERLRTRGIRVVATDIIMGRREREVSLAQAVLGVLG